MRDVAANVDEYINAFPSNTRVMLEQLRAAIRQMAPDAIECISYAMPAYKLHGMLVYFAGYDKHIGFYPGAGGISAFENELTGYKRAKGSVQFPLDKALPLELISRMVKFRVLQNKEKAKQTGKRAK